MAAPAATTAAAMVSGSRQRWLAMAPDSNDGDPLRIAVLSDVHGNLPAFEAVLDDVAGRRSPTRCGAWATSWATAPIPTNACELARRALRPVPGGQPRPRRARASIDIADFSRTRGRGRLLDAARTSARSTLEFLGGLEPEQNGEAIGLFHASPRDPVWEYVLSTAAGRRSASTRCSAAGLRRSATPTWRCDFTRDRRRRRRPAGATGGTELDIVRGEWLINPGSVGQPRDGDPRAAWLLLDTEQLDGSLAPRRVHDRRGGGGDPGRRAARVLAERLYVGQ